MKVSHIPIKELREAFGNHCTEEELRKFMGVYWAFPDRMEKLASLIDKVVKEDSKKEFEEQWAQTPQCIKDDFLSLFN